MTTTPFPINPALTAVSLAYRNADLIADQVCPRVRVSGETFKYLAYPEAEAYRVTDSTVGRASRPNEISVTATEVTGDVVDRALMGIVPQRDIESAANATGNYDPRGALVTQLTNEIALGREIRTAGLIFGASNYPAANKVALSGNDQWSAAHADSDPVADILSAMDAANGFGYNTLVLGRQVAAALRRHSAIGKALGGSAGDGRLASLDEIRDLFGLSKIIVGRAVYQTTKEGQTVSVGNVWGKHAALLYQPDNITGRGEPAFCATFQWGDRVARSAQKFDAGLRGGEEIIVGEAVKETVIASFAGHLFTNAIA
jgi:hypothetical protein